MRLDFSKAKVLVVGDLMLDRYFFGLVQRISPEAPVPVVKVSRSRIALGGAGNVANNLAHLGVNVELAGPLGSDEGGTIFREACRRGHIALCAMPMQGPTITKTRVIGEHQQVVRIDVEEELRWEGALWKQAQAVIGKMVRLAQVVVISDYGKGFCSPELCRFVIREARKTGKPVIVDPKGRDWTKYRGATVVTPNIRELSEIAGTPVANDDNQVAHAGRKVRAGFGFGALLVTRSERGMSLIENAGVYHVPTVAREVFDVSGAGDTVVATLAAALVNGWPLREAVTLANTAAGIVVAKIGTVPIEHGELDATVNRGANPKLVERNELLRLVGALREEGKTIVFTNGCFDILHRGNVQLLAEAKKHGDVLVVALNSDASAARQKGRGAPVNTESDRAHLTAAIDAVDYVTVFDEKTPLDLIRKIRPDVIVKGGNYRKDEVLGREAAGRVVIVPQIKGYSTAEIARRIGGKD
ncbi:MAG: D-glycero-beta-D-manno-heptose-7-phosphate kinase [Chitinispirillaceae bacterium]|nr:D-glycero-beta-D-manno-heptose-7-phosphate kinase [Chitinispirillaceae bacterium]